MENFSPFHFKLQIENDTWTLFLTHYGEWKEAKLKLFRIKRWTCLSCKIKCSIDDRIG